MHPIVQRVFLFGFCSNGMIALLPLVAREQFAGQLSAAQSKLQRLEAKIEEAVADKQHSNSELRRLRDQVRLARRALIEGERDYGERRPVEALRNIERASAELAALERALVPPAEPAAAPPVESGSGVWVAALAVLFGLPLLIVLLGHLVHFLRDHFPDFAAKARRLFPPRTPLLEWAARRDVERPAAPDDRERMCSSSTSNHLTHV